ncbi:MAG: hypothetical protein M3360_11115 [Actinomycetota bacterium]|nr:hypothetical protein [Actinomycetota bacterium]
MIGRRLKLRHVVIHCAVQGGPRDPEGYEERSGDMADKSMAPCGVPGAGEDRARRPPFTSSPWTRRNPFTPASTPGEIL